MVTLHAFLALAAGFLTMAVLVAALTALLMRLVPGWVGEQGKPQPGYIFVNLGYSFLAAAAGGYVTAWLAAANPLYHVLALGASSCSPSRLWAHCNPKASSQSGISSRSSRSRRSASSPVASYASESWDTLNTPPQQIGTWGFAPLTPKNRNDDA